MKKYISSLIPRLREFSASLDRKEFFIDVPWVIIDENLDQQKYIFRRDGTLIMSLNGQVTTGRWEYLSAAKCLLIDRIKDKILLNQNFIDPALMILRKDGTKDENLILANEVLIPDLDVEQYIRKLFYSKNRIFVKKLRNGELLEIHDYKVVFNNKVTIEGNDVPDGTYLVENSVQILVIVDSKISKILTKVSHKTNKGDIVIEQEIDKGYRIGDLVYQNDNPAADGKYRLNLLLYVTVENGRIIKHN